MKDLTDSINDIIKRAMKDHLNDSTSSGLPFLDPTDYKAKTGRRFRMSPEQISRGLTREQAFQEFVQKLMEKS